MDKKKLLRRVISTLISAIIIASLLPVSVFANDENPLPGDPEPTPTEPVEPVEPKSETEISVLDITDVSFTAFWNDNTGKTETDVENLADRPSMEDYLSACDLYFSTDNGNSYKLLNAENCHEIGLKPEEIPALSSAEGDKQYLYSATLPKTIEIKTTTENPEDPENPIVETETESVIYYLGNLEGDSVSPENVNGYLEPDVTYPESENPYKIDFTYTVKIKWDIDSIWYDNSNMYDTRPDFSHFYEKEYFTVYRHVINETTDYAVPVDVPFDIKMTDSGVKFSLIDAPAYDEFGDPYTYFIKFTDENICKNPEKNGEYLHVIENVGNFTSENQSIYNNGRIQLTLYNETTFKVNKVWMDDDQISERPNAKVYLYRVKQDENGTTSVDAIREANPVQGNDYVEVPVSGGNGSEYQLVFGDDSADKPLPMYDNRGFKYVYFALETGLAGSYHMEIDNTLSDESDIVKDVFSTFKISDKEDSEKYVLNDGVLTNIRKDMRNINAAKEFRTISLQSMPKASVKMKLQYKIAGRNEWNDATEEQIISYDDSIFSVDDKSVTVRIDGFCQEVMSQVVGGPKVRMFTESGAEIIYRWVETGIKIEGRDWSDVIFDGNEKYEDVIAGDFGPGVGNESTTVLFKPAYEDDDYSKVINRLDGEREMKVVKKWLDENGVNISSNTAEMDGFTISVDLFRNDGKSTVNGDLFDREGNKLEKLVLNINDYSASEDAWVGCWVNLPRYDNEGREYTYRIDEKFIDPSGKQWGYDVLYKSSVVDSSVSDSRIIETRAELVNSPIIGSNVLYFDVEKQWLDDYDLLTRKPVRFGVYRLSDDSLVAEGVLDESNEWLDRVYVTPTDENDSVSNYYVREISINGVNAVYDGTVNMLDMDYDAYNYADAVGHIGRKADGNIDERLDYDYNIYIQREDVSTKSADFLITNQRYAVVNYTVKKTWICSGKVPAAVFEIVNSETEERAKLTADMIKGASGSYKLNLSGEMANTVSLFPANISANKANYKYTTEVSVIGLPKYNRDGVLVQYDLNEVGLEIGAEFSPFNDKGKCEAGGDVYVANLQADKEQTIINGREGHHTEDEYFFKATNTRREVYPLTANKVWRDDGSSDLTSIRPDVSFNVYRISSEGFDGWDSADLNSALIAFIQSKGGASKQNLIYADHLWNTKHNDWYWSCDLGEVERYDENGFAYIYFLKEVYTGSKGNYSESYCNLNCSTAGYVPVEHPAVAPGYTSITTKEVFGIGRDLFTKDILILADGVHSAPTPEGRDCGAYYSRTTVNARQKTRTISGRKIWIMPTGWILPVDQRPEVNVKLYQIEGQYDRKQYYILSEIDDIVKDHEPIRSQILSNGYEFFLFDGLEYFDEFGRKYNYYISEDVIQNYNKDEVMVDMYDFYMKNTYTFNTPPYVKISVDKQWTSLVEGKKPTAPAKFTLYAKMTDENGNPIGNAITMASQVVLPQENAPFYKTVEFTKYGEQSASNRKMLPYYGPNTQPLIYWVEEQSIDGYTQKIPVKGTTEENNIELVKDSDSLYEGSVKLFENNYDAGSKKQNVDLKKNWVDVYDINTDGYRPASISVEIWRKWSDKTVDGVKAKGRDEPFAVPGGTGANGNVYVLSNANGWKLSLKNLDYYAPNGNKYTYYIKSETTADDNDSWLTTYSQAADGSNRKNTLKTTNIIAQKAWQTKIGNAAPKAMTNEEFVYLRDCGALPSKVAILYQRKVDGGEWEFVPVASNNTKGVLNGSTRIAGVETVITPSTTLSQAKVYANWKLTTYSPDAKAYTYRAVERITWKDGSTSWFYGNGEAENDVLQSPEGQFEEISANAAGFTITNVVPAIKIKLIKNWDDNGNRDNTRPANITLKVTTDGGSFSFTIKNPNADGGVPVIGNSWSGDVYTVAKPDVKDGKEIAQLLTEIYGISESDIVGYSRINADSDEFVQNSTDKDLYEYNLTNRLDKITIRKRTDISMEKTFANDDNFAEFTRPKVEFTLMFKKDGIFVDASSENFEDIAESYLKCAPVTLSVDAAKKKDVAKWTGLYRYWPRTDENYGIPDEIIYAVREEVIAADGTVISTSYTSNVNPAYSFTTSVDADDNAVKTYKITNTLNKTELDVSKSWIYSDGTDLDTVKQLIAKKYIPEEIRFKVYEANSDKAVAEQTFNVISVVSAPAKFNAFLPVYDANGEVMQYYIKESAARFKGENDFVDISECKCFNSSEKTDVSYDDSKFSASLVNTFTTTEIEAEKKWDDDNDRDRIRPESVKVNLFADGEFVKSDFITDDGTGEWKVKFEKLPEYNFDGSKVKYTLTEDAVEEYSSEVDNTSYIVKNSYTPEKVEVSFTKIWEDYDNNDGIRPEYITVNLYANGSEEPIDSIDAYAADGYSGKFTDLNKNEDGVPITYTVKEIDPEGYISEIKNSLNDIGEENPLAFVITNTHEKEKIEIPVNKIWDDDNDRDRVRPESITVTLYKDGEATENTVTLFAEEDWAPKSFTDLEKYEDGRIIEYSLVEDHVDGYETIYGDEAITNIHIPEKTQFTVVKVWDDENDIDKLRDKYGVTLMADGVKVGEEVILDKDTLTYTWSDLPKYDNGVEITYTVIETTVPEGYTPTVDDCVITNYHKHIAPPPPIPQTGTTMLLAGVISLVGAMILCFGIFIYRKRRKEN